MMRVSILGLLVAALALAPVAHAGWNELVFVGQGGDAPGEVTVELSGMPYEEGNVLSVVVKNGLQQTIWGTNYQTDCSIVTLEQWTGTTWKALPGCMSGAPLVPARINSGQSPEIRINPRSMNLAKLAVNSPLAFGQGLYRVAFGYRLTPLPPIQLPFVAYSQNFQINPKQN